MTDPTANSIDYLVIGHVSTDLTPKGSILGGTVAYAGRTAQALGLRVRAITAAEKGIDLSQLENIEILHMPSTQSTTFENRYTSEGRVQILHGRASDISSKDVPRGWQSANIVHLGPIADEVDTTLIESFPDALMCITPQGWLRNWDDEGRVQMMRWDHISDLLPTANVVVISMEDLADDLRSAQDMADRCEILAVTDSVRGAQVFWDDHQHDVPVPEVEEVDPTGSGDIFAAAFFAHLYQTSDPLEAARFANCLAAASVTRQGLASTPTMEDIQDAYHQVTR
jgi:sugar/nucleoside kinase (ribokinase family)